jgi:hypothetical protein
MRYVVSFRLGDTRLYMTGDYRPQAPEGVPRWTVEGGYLADPGVSPVTLDGIAGDSVDDLKAQALLRAGLVEVGS